MGQSRYFDGSNDLITVAGHANLDNPSAFTLGFWINFIGQGSTSFPNLILKNSGLWSIIALNLGAGKMDVRFRVITDMSPLECRGNEVLNTGDGWVFLVLDWNGGLTAATDGHIYKNDVEVSYDNKTDGTGSVVTESTPDLLIGNNAAKSNPIEADIAYVQFFNRVLSAAERTEIRLFPGSITAGLLLFLPLLGEASPEPDLSGNGHDGTIDGATESFTGPPVQLLKALV